MKEIICHKCSHSINEHDMGWGECQRIGCSCRLTPNDVAATAVEQAKRELYIVIDHARKVLVMSTEPHDEHFNAVENWLAEYDDIQVDRPAEQEQL